MLGVAFAAQGVSQVGNVTEAFAQARVAVFEALVAINRKPGSPEKVIYKTEDDVDELGSTAHSQSSRRSRDVEKGEEREIKAILPPFRIDASSSAGLKPKVLGQISFRNVGFHYPTRPGDTVLIELSFDVEAGETVALVGTLSNSFQRLVFADRHDVLT
jgi:ABC-type multidrug transport system fused ATPase/permease subunit